MVQTRKRAKRDHDPDPPKAARHVVVVVDFGNTTTKAGWIEVGDSTSHRLAKQPLQILPWPGTDLPYIPSLIQYEDECPGSAPKIGFEVRASHPHVAFPKLTIAYSDAEAMPYIDSSESYNHARQHWERSGSQKEHLQNAAKDFLSQTVALIKARLQEEGDWRIDYWMFSHPAQQDSAAKEKFQTYCQNAVGEKVEYASQDAVVDRVEYASEAIAAALSYLDSTRAARQLVVSVDCGGGTADVALFAKQEARINLIEPTTGAFCGPVHMTLAASKILLAQYPSSTPAELYAVGREFDDFMRKWSGEEFAWESETKHYIIEASAIMKMFDDQMTKIRELIDGSLKCLFVYATNETTRLKRKIDQQIATSPEMEDHKYYSEIVLTSQKPTLRATGGFSSFMEMKRMLRQYNEAFEVSIDSNPRHAVMNGLSVITKNPRQFVLAVTATYNYGVDGYHVYDEAKHGPLRQGFSLTK